VETLRQSNPLLPSWMISRDHCAADTAAAMVVTALAAGALATTSGGPTSKALIQARSSALL
jgi:hypothetical protein